ALAVWCGNPKDGPERRSFWLPYSNAPILGRHDRRGCSIRTSRIQAETGRTHRQTGDLAGLSRHKTERKRARASQKRRTTGRGGWTRPRQCQLDESVALNEDPG